MSATASGAATTAARRRGALASRIPRRAWAPAIGRATATAALLSGALTAIAAPSPDAALATARPTRSLHVFAAASLAEPFGELARAFERAHPGVAVRLNLAGSQQLAAQIEQGATADVMASADARWIRALGEHDRLAGAPATFARNRLVVILPRTHPARVSRLQDLARPGVKVVLGAPTVPVGAYARQMLSRLARLPGYGDDFARRVGRNVVSEEESVRGVVGKVQLGEADAGIAYRSDVAPRVRRFVTVLDVPDAANVVAVYPIAVLRHAAEPALAAEFVALVRSEEGRRVLVRHGFEPPVTPPSRRQS